MIRRSVSTAETLKRLRAEQNEELRQLYYLRALRNAPLVKIRQLEAKLAQIQNEIERLRRAA